MPIRSFAILEHTTPDLGVHHDLLIDRPGAPDPLPETDDDAKTLWAVRIEPPPQDWHRLNRLPLTPLPPHRRRYLTYQGPLTAGRGTVRQIIANPAWVQTWAPAQAKVFLHMKRYLISLDIKMPDEDNWAATVRKAPKQLWM